MKDYVLMHRTPRRHGRHASRAKEMKRRRSRRRVIHTTFSVFYPKKSKTLRAVSGAEGEVKKSLKDLERESPLVKGDTSLHHHEFTFKDESPKLHEKGCDGSSPPERARNLNKPREGGSANRHFDSHEA